MENIKLIASFEDYLKTIYLLHQEDIFVRVIDISERMSASNPGVFNAVSQLSDMGLIEQPHTVDKVSMIINIAILFSVTSQILCSMAQASEHANKAK